MPSSAQPAAQPFGQPLSQDSDAAQTFDASHMAGLWAAETVFGPEVRGALVLRALGDEWVAEIQGHAAAVDQRDGVWSFALPGERGSFRGSMSGDRLSGFWTQPAGNIQSVAYATPTTLEQAPDGSWRGLVEPLQERISLYFEFLLEDGALMARLRNPERNVGVFYNLGRAEVRGRDLVLYDHDGDEVLLQGRIAASGERWSLDLEGGGVTLEFTRRSRDTATGYYPADANRSTYAYRPPLACGDGWPVASASDVGLKQEPLEALVQSVLDTRYEARTTPYIHSIQVARHGKLVLDEYFYGYHRDRTHDTRSSGKTLSALLTGIAIDRGAPFTPESSVLEIFAEEAEIENVDERKRALTVEHLLTMRSGFHCDDNVWDTPGNEDRMQSQGDQPDWIRYALDLPMQRAPGERAVYCTAGINLLGGVVEETTGTEILRFFHETYAEPLGIERYHMNLDPLGRGYMGGGIRLRPRDHMKLGQLLVGEGKWLGEQVVSAKWIERMSDAHASIHIPDDYGYGTWRRELTHDGATHTAIYASGNGGQFVIAIPSVDVVVLFTAGNYMDFGTWSAFLTGLVPAHVLSAVEG